MKYLLICLVALSFNAKATSVDLGTVDDPSKAKYNAEQALEYKAEKDDDFKGRNENMTKTSSGITVTKGDSLTTSVSVTSSQKQAQVENLESASGEMVRKLEDDRLKQTKNQQTIYEKARELLIDAYELTKTIHLGNLGAEQDPIVKNAFKCEDLEDCDKNTDKRVIKQCSKNEMIHWTGHVWDCISIFEVPNYPNCGNDQYLVTLPNNDKACADYIYVWQNDGYSSCNSEALKDEIYKCYRKKDISDKGTVVSDSKCLGEKPEGKSDLCLASWNVGSWGSCSKSCGGGTQTRSVTCPANHICNEQKPSTSQLCNQHQCTADWQVGPWGSCSNGTKYRDVWCPSGYHCPGSKPATASSCSTGGSGGGCQTTGICCNGGCNTSGCGCAGVKCC